MNNEFNGGFGGLSYQGGQQPMNNGMMNQQPMMGQDMNQGMMNQQPMMNQDMNQGMMSQQPMMGQGMNNPVPQQPMGGAQFGMNNAPVPGNKTANNNKMLMLIPVVMFAVILVVILLNVVFTKTLKCNEIPSTFKYFSNAGVEVKSNSKQVFKFGKPSYTYAKVVLDFSDADDDVKLDNDAINDLKKQMKKSCKSSDGCTFSVKKSGKKLTITEKDKYTKEEKEDFEDFIEDYYDGEIKDFYEQIEDSCEE